MKKETVNQNTIYIFLDIDGVLNRESDWINPFSLNKECVNSFHALINSNNYKIVLSSSWRNGYSNTNESQDGSFINHILESNGIYVSDVTPTSNKSRQEEIEYYINRHNISNYIILDDDESLFPNSENLNLYLTDFKSGLTLNDVKKITKMNCKRIAR